jgi:cytohesin
MIIRRFLAAIALLVLLSVPVARGHETDQFILPPGRQFADLGDVFTHWSFDILQRAVEKTNGEIEQILESPNPDKARLERLYSQDHMTDAVHSQIPWALNVIEDLERNLASGQVRAKYPGLVVSHKQFFGNIYQSAGIPIDPRQLIRLFYSADFQAYGIHMGTDKIGHFTDMGLNYYRAYRSSRRAGNSEEVARQAAVHLGTKDIVFSEAGFLGFITAGSFSNADLVSNYTGFLFFRNVTEPTRLKGEVRPAMIVRDGDYWRLNDHVARDSDFFSYFFCEHFDESMNPSVYDPTIRPGIRSNIQAHAGRILQRHADIHGNRRGKEYFDNWVDALHTYYGEDYGHAGKRDQLVCLGTTLFGPIQEERDVAERGQTGHASLHRAAAMGDVEAIKRILARGAEVDIRVRSNEFYSSEWGNTPLHLAARDGREEAVAALIEAKADVNAVNDRGVSVLHRAIAHPKVAEMLISKGAKVDAADVRGHTPLHYCARDKDAKIVGLLLDKGAAANAVDKQGRSAVHLAAEYANADAMKVLLDRGARVDVADQFQLTPLHLAAGQRNTAVVRMLLDKKASTSARCEFARTPLHDAARNGSVESVRMLLEAGADPAWKDAYGTTALHLACRRSRAAVAKLIMERGVDVNVQNAAGSTALHEAARVGDWPLVRVLLARAADPQLANKKKHTPLKVASDHRRDEVVRVLQNEAQPRVAAKAASTHAAK